MTADNKAAMKHCRKRGRAKVGLAFMGSLLLDDLRPRRRPLTDTQVVPSYTCQGVSYLCDSVTPMRASRLLSILLSLQARGRLTAAGMAEELEGSERTIHRDIDHLSAAGAPAIA